MKCDVKNELERAYHSAVREFQECVGEHSAALTLEHAHAAQARLDRLKRQAQAALKELEDHRKVHGC